MSYCALSDVQELIPKFSISATSTPTSTQVESLIDKIAVEIDAVLEAQGFTVPVTSPANFVLWLKNLNALGAAARAMQGMFPSTADKDSTPVWQTFRKDYQEGLEAIRNGDIPAGLGKGADGLNAGSLYTSGAISTDEYPEPVFRISSSGKEF